MTTNPLDTTVPLTRRQKEAKEAKALRDLKKTATSLGYTIASVAIFTRQDATIYGKATLIKRSDDTDQIYVVTYQFKSFGLWLSEALIGIDEKALDALNAIAGH